jgi:hypothetical protein
MGKERKGDREGDPLRLLFDNLPLRTSAAPHMSISRTGRASVNLHASIWLAFIGRRLVVLSLGLGMFLGSWRTCREAVIDRYTTSFQPPRLIRL